MADTVEESVKEWLSEKGIEPSDADKIIEGGKALIELLRGRELKRAEAAGDAAANKVVTADDAEATFRRGGE